LEFLQDYADGNISPRDESGSLASASSASSRAAEKLRKPLLIRAALKIILVFAITYGAVTVRGRPAVAFSGAC
jgi:hypothetical protein